ncbi:MAG TPA: radical SAM family heme chaperone HemW [Oceanithermus profundus]|uniref:Heme chaperone HemW n=1 Tax=Oceanithermus profundus TaxID=187137 RepID=A0A7C4Z5B6_9DEIN|nr:radical SAM family heme chaperone HemW [Oceanithermus profundus]
MRHLYLHVPFCPTICPYCDFHVVRRGPGLVERYLERLEAEAAELYARRPGALDTLYLGGGTPSYLRDRELARLFTALPWPLAPDAEVTLEANPGTLNPARLEHLRSLGVNRISIGVQSFQDPVLARLGRAHKGRGALRTVEEALAAGFRVSLDLILGLPGQDAAADLETAAALGVGHVSAYTLQVEPGTPFALAGLEPDPDHEAEAFELARAVLGRAGLARYEVSNFARPGEEARHNLAYWRMAEWGGLGPAASAHFFTPEGPALAERLTNPPLPRWAAGEPPAREAIGPLEHAKEALMLGLRLREGVEPTALEARTGLPLASALAPVLEERQAQGLVRLEGGRLRPSDRGLDRLHGVVLALWEALERAYSEI